MDERYKRTATTVSLIHYHFVFCPRYRRKIFDVPGVEERFRELTASVCVKNHIEILTMECGQDYIHMFVSVDPSLSVSNIMHCIKSATSNQLREEFPVFAKMPSIWTRSYFVSTEAAVPPETIQWYVESQKKRC